jgi:hypothetical protein
MDIEGIYRKKLFLISMLHFFNNVPEYPPVMEEIYLLSSFLSWFAPNPGNCPKLLLVKNGIGGTNGWIGNDKS